MIFIHLFIFLLFMTQRRSQGGSCGARDPPLVSHVLSKQPTTGGKNDMKIW